MRIIIKLAQRVLIFIVIVSSLVADQKENNSPYSFSRSLDMKIAGLSGSLLLGSMLMSYESMDLNAVSYTHLTLPTKA